MLRFVRPEVDAVRAEVADFLAWNCCAFEDVLLPGDLKTFESGGHDRGLERCLQQRPGDSVGPEVDVALGSLRDLLLDCDVGDLNTATGAEHPVDLFEDPVLVRREVHDPV